MHHPGGAAGGRYIAWREVIFGKRTGENMGRTKGSLYWHPLRILVISASTVVIGKNSFESNACLLGQCKFKKVKFRGSDFRISKVEKQDFSWEQTTFKCKACYLRPKYENYIYRSSLSSTCKFGCRKATSVSVARDLLVPIARSRTLVIPAPAKITASASTYPRATKEPLSSASALTVSDQRLLILMAFLSVNKRVC